MASTPVTANDLLKPSSNGLNDLFTRINTMRANHLTASQAAGTSTTNITSAWPTNVVATGQTAQATTVTDLDNRIRAVGASGSFTENNASTRYATSITVPSVGALIKATDFNAWDTVLTNMEKVCSHYTRYSSFYSGHYGSFYSSFYSGHYGSEYSSFYSSFYSGNYGSFYSSFYSGNYGGRYARSCLLKGTKILLKDNKQEKIENINIGDEVIVWNENTKQLETKKVLVKKEHLNIKKVIKLYLSNGTNLILTPGHPVLTEKGWASLDEKESLKTHGIYANKLQINDNIIGLNNQTNKLIKIEELNNGSYICYDLSIDRIHNFIAITGEKDIDSVIVHNGKVCTTGIC